MSSLQSALLVNVVVLLTTLRADLGTKPVTGKRLRRPLLIAAIIIPVFVHTIYRSGPGQVVEIAGAAAGILVGLIAVSQMRVHAEPSGGVVSRAGAPYAAVWIALSVGRSLFSYGATHWFSSDLGTFFVERGAAPADVSQIITNGLVIMAVAALLTRSAGLMIRAKNHSGAAQQAHPKP